MKEFSVPFSLFDFFAVLFPGAVGIFGVYLFMNPSLTQTGHDAAFSQIVLQRPIGDLSLVTGLVLTSYLLGHVLNALSEVLVDRPVNRFFGAHIVCDLNHHNVQKAIQKKFGDDILKQSFRRTFIMVESTVGANMPDAAATAKKFIALAVMFQSLALTLLFIGAALIRGYTIGEVFSDSFISFALVMVFILMLVALMLWSYRRYKRMWSQTWCMSFVAWVTLE
jgi:hypothetical protein